MIQLRKGFTLIELLVVIAVIGVLSAGVVMAINVGSKINSANIAKTKTFASSIENNLAINQIGKWSFEEGSGTTTKDVSGYGNAGALYSVAPASITWNNAAACGLGFGGCLSFGGGTNGYVDYGNIYNETPGIKYKMTVTAWFKADTVVGERSILTKRQYSIDNRMFGVMLLNSSLVFRVADDSNNEYDVNTPFTDINTWHYVVATWGNGSQKLYLDGTLKASSLRGFTKLNDSTGSFEVGAVDSGVSGWFDGFIDEVAVYNEPLSLSHIQQLYAQGLKKHQLTRK